MGGHRPSVRIGNCLDSPTAKRELNERMFTVIAPEYSWVTAALSFGRDSVWKRRLVEALPSVRRPVCVDIACGTGDLTRLLARRFPDGTVTGIDLTGAMLERARVATCDENVRYRSGDMMNVPFADGAADLVTGGYALRNAPELEGAIAEVTRMLRVGGHAGFLDFTRWPGRIWGSFWGIALHGNADVYAYIAESLARFPTTPELVARFRSNGLRTVKTIPFFFGITSILILRKETSP
jgi:ubiquinone/menaquinone biosynthesis methyltransferase